MRRIDRQTDTMFAIENSTVDPNRFYSILLDARAAAVSENMCDIAVKLLQMEKDNARSALDQLMRLRNNLFSTANPTIDLLITFYEDKLGVLREKEERLKKVSLDSRSLLEDKRRRDEEIATVKQQVVECSKEMDELGRKLEKLKIREQELTLIEHQLREELNRNENEIINGLYEIILPPQQEELEEQEVQEPSYSVNEEPTSEISIREEPETEEKKDDMVQQWNPPQVTPAQPLAEPAPAPQSARETTTVTAVFEPPVIPAAKDLIAEERQDGDEGSRKEEEPEIAPFPKSVVKTNDGRIIGEYHYDARVYKNERHYIFNTLFFAGELLSATAVLRKGFDPARYNDLIQVIEDAYKRITGNKQLHFEVATNEILNEKTLKRLWQDAKLRSIDEVGRFGSRLNAKIEALGGNYETMLREQMQRCIQKSN